MYKFKYYILHFILMYAVWLTFSKNDTEYFSNIIKQYAIRYDSPKFVPHITVYGLVNAPIGIVEKSILSLTLMKKFKIKNLKTSHSPKLWKSVFCEIESNDKLIQISTRLADCLKKYAIYKFEPHVSLLYKKLIKSEREKIVTELRIKKSFFVNQIAVIKFNDQIEKWKIVRRYKLQ